MSQTISSLGSVLDGLPRPSDPPMALPMAHLSISRWFESIVDAGVIVPRSCGVFNRDLAYYFYGGVFYRTTDKPTRNASELPIAFLFAPPALARVDGYYPFDTGAMAEGLYGGWSDRFRDFRSRLRVDGTGSHQTPSLIVSHIYGSNERYLAGDVNASLNTLPEPLPQLHDFLTEDLSDQGIDSRQNRIECHVTVPVALDRELLWVGYPESLAGIFARIYKHSEPHVPESFSYASHRIYKPSEVAAKLELEAEKVVSRYVALPKARGTV